MKSLIMPALLALQLFFASDMFSQMSPPIISPTDPNQNQVNPLTNPGNPISNPGVPSQSNPVNPQINPINPGVPPQQVNPTQPNPAMNPSEAPNVPYSSGADNTGMPVINVPSTPTLSIPTPTIVQPQIPTSDSVLAPRPLMDTGNPKK